MPALPADRRVRPVGDAGAHGGAGARHQGAAFRGHAGHGTHPDVGEPGPVPALSADAARPYCRRSLGRHRPHGGPRRIDPERLALLDHPAIGIDDDPRRDALRTGRHRVAAGLGLPRAVVLRRDTLHAIALRFDAIARVTFGVGIAGTI